MGAVAFGAAAVAQEPRAPQQQRSPETQCDETAPETKQQLPYHQPFLSQTERLALRASAG
jgi:hypothetical protein